MTDRPVITYHGGGYVGLTGAVHFAQAGWKVTIYDPDRATVDGINAGHPRAGDFLHYLDSDVAALVTAGQLRATTKWSEAVWAAVHVVAVPTERDGEPYDAIVLAVLRRLIGDASPESTILVESTLTPGTINRVWGGVRHGREGAFGSLRVAVCPRRDWFADRTKNLGNMHRVVGGVTPACTAKALDIYATVTPRELLQPTDYRTAELVKALENALLHLPVTFCHQLASALPDHNVAEAMRLASTHWRFASMGPLYLGFGTGGRCVPLGTQYLFDATWGGSITKDSSALTLGREAIDADEGFAQVVAGLVEARANRVAVLGMAYRPEFRDAGRSPGLRVARALTEGDIPIERIAVHDPLWTPEELTRLTGFSTVSLEDLSGFDAVLLATPHRVYARLPGAVAWRAGQLVLDGSGAWAKYREAFTAMGVDYRQVGEAGWLRTSGKENTHV